MQQIADGVWRLEAAPFDLLNVYLLGDVLIDAGTRWNTGRILRQLRGRAVRMVALTHCHPDHQGAAWTVCEKFGVPLACHEADSAAAEGKGPMLPDNRVLRFGSWLLAGPPCRVGKLLANGDEINGFRVIHTPGHTPGHVIFFRDHDRVAIAGDLLANFCRPFRGPVLREPPTMYSVDPELNRRSVAILASLEPSIICFGHGPPLTDPGILRTFLASQGMVAPVVQNPVTGCRLQSP